MAAPVVRRGKGAGADGLPATGPSAKQVRSSSLDVYLGEELIEQVRRLAREKNASLSAVCRELIFRALVQPSADAGGGAVAVEQLVKLVQAQALQLKRLEVLAATGVALSAIDQLPPDGNTSDSNAAFTQVLLQGVRACPNVLGSAVIEAVVASGLRK